MQNLNIGKKDLKSKLVNIAFINFIIIGSLILNLAFSTENSNAKPVIIIVDPEDDERYQTIQGAIDNASASYIISVAPGTYYENIIINKSITLVGSGVEHTTIFGNNSWAVVKINASRCNLTGFTITGFKSYSTLEIEGDSNNIKDSRFIGNVIGISLLGANNNLIENCICQENSGAGMVFGSANHNTIVNTHCIESLYGDGINLFNSYKNVFRNGTCNRNADDGMYAYWLSNYNRFMNYTFNGNERNGAYLFDSDKCVIENCISSENGFNGFVISSTENTINNCTSSSNGGDGFYMYHSEGSIITNCSINKNVGRGFYLKYCDKNILTQNTLISNQNLGIELASNSNSNQIYLNDLINNNQGIGQALDRGNDNHWDKDEVGNYWWDYTYFYPNASSDGQVWDIAYKISITKNTKDHYPLMRPRGNEEEIELIQPGIMKDNDADGIYDLIDALPNNKTEWKDSDDDGIGNNADPDDDNDGITDISEIDLGTEPELNDTDGDNFDDKLDVYPLDSTRWEEQTEADEEDTVDTKNWLVFVIIDILLIVLIIVFLIKIKKRIKK